MLVSKQQLCNITVIYYLSEKFATLNILKTEKEDFLSSHLKKAFSTVICPESPGITFTLNQCESDFAINVMRQRVGVVHDLIFDFCVKY